MAKKEFIINDWLQTEESNNIQPVYAKASTIPNSDTELILQRIEANQIDITTRYSDWRDLGFAFADEFGDIGRSYFHRVSRFYHDYSPSECDKQFDKCLKSNGNGVNIQTFFYKAKQTGINIVTTQNIPLKKQIKEKVISSENEEEKSIFDTPYLPIEIYDSLSEILKESTELFQGSIEKDVFIIGAISVLSGCIPNIQGEYFNEFYTPHLYAFITSPAGAGKGNMKWAKYFGQLIHDDMVQ